MNDDGQETDRSDGRRHRRAHVPGQGDAAQNKRRETSHNLTGQVREKEHNIEMANAQIQQARADIQSAVDETGRMHAEISSAETELASRRAELVTVSEEINAEESVLQSRNEEVGSLKVSLAERENSADDCEKKILAIVQQSSRLKSAMSALETREESLSASVAKLEAEREEVAGQSQDALTALSDAEVICAEETRASVSLEEELEQVGEEIAQARAGSDAEEASLQAIKDAWLTRSSTLASVKELRQKFEGFGEGVKSLLSEGGPGIAGMREALADVLQSPAEYEKAIESVLGEKLQSIIVGSHADSVAAINYLDANRSGRGSFIPLQGRISQRPQLYLNGNPKIIGKAVDLVQTPAEYRSVVERLLGDVVITEDLETAITLHAAEGFCGTAVTLHARVGADVEL